MSRSEELQITDLFLAVLAVVAMTVSLLRLTEVVPDDVEIAKLLGYLDLGICVLFFADFVRMLVRSERPLRYLVTWGLFDLVSSIPTILLAGQSGEVVRMLRLARLMRVLRAVRSLRILYLVGRKDRSMAILAGLFMLGILLFMGSCIGVLWAEEHDPASKLNTAENVLWWAVVTSSTVGYGELYPVTNAGRGFAVVLMVVGIGAFATLTSAFGVLVGRVRQGRVPGIDSPPPAPAMDASGAERLQRIEEAMARLEAKIDAMRSPDPGSDDGNR
ncbi:MAG: hypothetical protein RLZZ461_1035 [Planctomycetota bacterium]|jgi:voltage-gated potassium channel